MRSRSTRACSWQRATLVPRPGAATPTTSVTSCASWKAPADLPPLPALPRTTCAPTSPASIDWVCWQYAMPPGGRCPLLVWVPARHLGCSARPRRQIGRSRLRALSILSGGFEVTIHRKSPRWQARPNAGKLASPLLARQDHQWARTRSWTPAGSAASRSWACLGDTGEATASSISRSGWVWSLV